MTNERPIRIRFEPPLVLPGTDAHSVVEVNSEVHGPVTFSAVGVSFQVDGVPCFAPWGVCNGVTGWQPELEPKRGGK